MYVLNGIVVYISSTLYCGLKVLVLYATVKYRIAAPYHKGITKVTRHSAGKAASLYQTVYIVLIFYNITDSHCRRQPKILSFGHRGGENPLTLPVW